LLERVRADLNEMDVAVLEPSPVFTMTGTPIVMPPATPTARPTQPGSKPAPQGAIVVDLSAGTGPLVLRPNDYPVYRFQPPSPVRYKSVESLTVELETEHPAGIPDLQLYFWSPESGGWREQDAVWGANVIDSPWIPVGAQGDVYVGLRNWGAETIYLENVRIILVVLNNADEKIVIGPDEP
jgi:hypothetical protein